MAGAYVCQFTLTSAGLTLAPGGPARALVAPAAREYAALIETSIATSAVATQVACRKNIADPVRNVLGPEAQAGYRIRRNGKAP